MATWKTGRSRTLVFSGVTNGGCDVTEVELIGGNVSVSYGSNTNLVIQCFGFQITMTSTASVKGYAGPGPTPYDLEALLSVTYGFPLYSNTNVVEGESVYGVNNPRSDGGSWEITAQVEEWAQTYTPTSVAPVNGTDFPTFGGSAQGDGLPAQGIQYFEQIIAGTNITFTANYGGLSYSTTIPIATETPVPGYLIYGDALAGPNAHCAYTSNRTCASTFNFNSNTVGCSYTAANGIDSVSCSSGVSATVSGANARDSSECIASINPPLSWTVYGRLQCFGSAFPSPGHNLSWNCLASGGPTVLLNPSGIDSVTQNQFEAYAVFNGTPQTGLSAADQVPVSCYLSSLGLDDSRDWRCMIRGYKWDALTLTAASTQMIDDCTSLAHWTAGTNTALSLSSGVVVSAAGGVGSVVLAIPSGVQVWECFRFLQISGLFTAPPYDSGMAYDSGAIVIYSGDLYQALSSTIGNPPSDPAYWSPYPGPVTLTVAIAGQNWALPLTSHMTTPQLDLCCAPTDTESVDSTQTRYPLSGIGGFPTATNPSSQYKLGWGVNYCVTLAIEGIPDGCSITLTSVQLMFSSDPQHQSAITLLEPFQGFVPGWADSGVSVTSVQDYLLVETDYRILDIPALCLVTPTGPGTPSYVWYTITQFQEILAYYPSLTATLLTCPVSDGYHGDAQLALNLGGEGATYDWTSLGWSDWIDSPLGVTIPAQDLWDEVQVYPGAGNVWPQEAVYGGSTPIQTSKSLRAQGWGLVFTPAGASVDGAQVVLYETSNPSSGEGSGTSGNLGQFSTGMPWAYGNIDSQLDLNAPPIPHLTEHEVIQNRQRFRGSFRHSQTSLKSLGYDVANSLRHSRTYVNTATGHIGMGCASNVLPLTWTDLDTGIAATWARPRFQDQGSSWPIGLFYGDGTNCSFALTNDEGSTWGTIIDMSTGSIGDFEEGANGLRWFFNLQSPDSGSTWNIWGRLLDAQLNVVRDWTITNLTGVDNAPIAVRESPGNDGSWRIGLFYSTGGSPTVAFSFDGLNFS